LLLYQPALKKKQVRMEQYFSNHGRPAGRNPHRRPMSTGTRGIHPTCRPAPPPPRQLMLRDDRNRKTTSAPERVPVWARQRPLFAPAWGHRADDDRSPGGACTSRPGTSLTCRPRSGAGAVEHRRRGTFF
jgi:hypothetical protein